MHICGTIFLEHPWEVMYDLYFSRDSEETEKGEEALTVKAMPKEKLQGEQTAPALEFTTAQPEVADGPECMRVPSAPVQEFPDKDWGTWSTTEVWSATLTAQATEWERTTIEWS